MFSSVISKSGAPDVFEDTEEEVAPFLLLLEANLFPPGTFLLTPSEALPVADITDWDKWDSEAVGSDDGPDLQVCMIYTKRDWKVHKSNSC